MVTEVAVGAAQDREVLIWNRWFIGIKGII